MRLRNDVRNGFDQMRFGWFGNPAFQVVLRLCLCSAFLFSAISKVLDFQGATAEIRALVGFEPAALLAVVVIVVQAGGSALMLVGGRMGLAGAALLAGFTFVVTLLAHSAWISAGVIQFDEANIFFEHLGLVAGLLLSGWLGVGALEGWR